MGALIATWVISWDIPLGQVQGRLDDIQMDFRAAQMSWTSSSLDKSQTTVKDFCPKFSFPPCFVAADLKECVFTQSYIKKFVLSG